MVRPNTASALLLLTLLVTACAPTTPQADPEEIRRQYNAYNITYGKNDVETILAFYTDDAERLPSDGSIVSGLAALREVIVAFREQNDYVLDAYSPPRIQVSGDLAVTYATFDEHWTSKATAETTREAGRWLLVWERQSDGSWKISKEMWTIQQPQ